MPNPACQVKDGVGSYESTDDGVDVTSGNTITINLVSSAGVRSWAITCIGTDELSDAEAVNDSLVVDATAKTATFTAPGDGSAYIFQSVVNGGIDVNGDSQESYTTTFGVYTLTTEGKRVLAVNSTTESNQLFGWIADINSVIRDFASGGGGEGGGDGAIGYLTKAIANSGTPTTLSEAESLNAAWKFTGTHTASRTVVVDAPSVAGESYIRTALNLCTKELVVSKGSGTTVAMWPGRKSILLISNAGVTSIADLPLDVRDFGAVRYPTLAAARASTDHAASTAGIQAALDAMGDVSNSSIGVELVIPAGYYRISSDLVFRRSGIVRGAGGGGRFCATVLAFDDGVSAKCDNVPVSSDGGRADWLRIESIRFQGPATKTTPVSQGLYIRTRVYLENVAVIGFHGRGIHANAGEGVDGTNANDGGVKNVWIEDNSSDGWYIHGGDASLWTLQYIHAASNGQLRAPAKVWSVDESAGPSYTDLTTAINNATSGDVALFPATEAEGVDGVGDWVAFGQDSIFTKLLWDNKPSGTPGVGGTVAWEYWNGSAWTALPALRDATIGFTIAPVTDGKVIGWGEPFDWAARTINGSASLYWVRARVTHVYSTNPVGDQIWTQYGYGVRESSFLGNTYINLHTEGNGAGLWVDGDANQSLFLNLYTEADQGSNHLHHPAMVLGGNSYVTGFTPAYDDTGIPGNPSGNGFRMLAGSLVSPFTVTNPTSAGYELYASFGAPEGQTLMQKWSKSGHSYELRWNYDDTNKFFECAYSSSPRRTYVITSEGNSNGAGWMQFPSGFMWNAGRIQTSATAVPSGVAERASTFWIQGDVAWNRDQTATGVVLWSCIADGSGGTPAGTWVRRYAPKRGATSAIAVTNANVTLSATQQTCRSLVFTGTLTGNISVFLLVPADAADGAEFVVDTVGVAAGAGPYTMTLRLVGSVGTSVVATLGTKQIIETRTTGVETIP